MSYGTVEAGLQTEIRAIAAFSDGQVSISDHRVLATGHPHVAILTYRSFVAERDSADQKTLFTWTTRIQLYVRYTTDVDSAKAMRDRRDDIITRILNNPKLNNTAFDSMPVRGSVSIDEKVEIGGVPYLVEFIDVEIEERVSA
jgi:hypothetical protein